MANNFNEKAYNAVTDAAHFDIDDILALGANYFRCGWGEEMYYNHSMYPGGLRERTARTMKEKYPVEMMERAVKGMLPHNRLGRQMYKKLFVYEGETHTQQAQKPVSIEL